MISVVEATSAYGVAQAHFIASLDSGDIEAVTSELTVAECLVNPFMDHDLKAI
ncbi:MAG: hypothetical protein JNM20_11035 [Rhizobiales bacterium]|nr:hypothetical protein [Hyphomicrobiales bacterium]